jgi:hypothetical protein
MFPPDVSTTFVYIFVCIWGHLEIGLNRIKSAKDYAHPSLIQMLNLIMEELVLARRKLHGLVEIQPIDIP